MSRRAIERAASACFLAAAVLGGCGESGSPVVRMRSGAKDVYFVTHEGEEYYLCRTAELRFGEDNVLCDEHGRRLSKAPIAVPGDAEKLWVRSDGMVLAWCDDYWVGVGQLTLLRVHDADAEEPPKSARRLWELGTRCIPGQGGCPKVKEVRWALREPGEAGVPRAW